MSLALATQISPMEWEETYNSDPRLIATAIDILERQARKHGR